MGSMTDERRIEMEQEMMRFEQEIFTTDDDEIPVRRPSKQQVVISQEPKASVKTDANLVLADKAEDDLTAAPGVERLPPSAKEESSTKDASLQQQTFLSDPLMPPGSQQTFIPHQVQHRAQVRPPRLLPPPMPPRGFQGPMMPFSPMNMPPMRMPMNSGFCPPPPGIGPMPPGMRMMQPHRPFIPPPPPPPMSMQYREPLPRQPQKTTASSMKANKSQSIFTSAPTVYSAAPTKNQPTKRPISAVQTNSERSTDMENSSVTSSQAPTEPKVIKTVVETTVTTTVTVPTTVAPPAHNELNFASKKKEKKKKIVRMGGGQAWEDNSLMDWESDDFRIFCGDLGNDVTDEVLIRAFSKYPSFGKAKVIRDKRTNKTKGYGFVSFKDPQDFIKAMREMNGRYVGSRPIKLRKSTWKDRNIDIVRKKQKEKEKLGLL